MRLALWGALCMTPWGRRIGQRAIPVHDRDVWLLIVKELLPQALGQKVHTLLLHGPAVREGTGKVRSGSC